MALFRSQKDIDYVKRINQELIEKVISEKITYYAISDQYSEKNFYGESKEKVFDPPVEIYALVEWIDQDVTTTEFGQDIIYGVNVSILDKHLKDINIKIHEGDMIDYQGFKFEIHKVNTQMQIFGKAYNDIGVTLSCKSIRESSFETTISGTVDQPPRTRPDNDTTASFYYSDVTFPYSGSSE